MSGTSRITPILAGIACAMIAHWLYTRREKKALKEECRGAAIREMLTAREFIQATLEDSDSARSFRKDVALVRESWNKLKPNRLELTAHHMYAALLEMDDSARDIFDSTLNWTSQERIFTVMVNNLLCKLDETTTDGLLQTLTSLGKRHHLLGVRPSHYMSMQRAILSSLAELLGSEWTFETEAAWASVFSFISQIMIKVAHEPDPQPSSSSSSGTTSKGEEGHAGAGINKYANKYIATIRDDVAATDGHLFLHRHSLSSGSDGGGGVRIIEE